MKCHAYKPFIESILKPLRVFQRSWSIFSAKSSYQQFHAGTSQFSQAECGTSAHAKKLSTLYSQYVQWREIIEREETLEVFFDLLFAEMDENLVQELSEELLSFQKAVNIILYSSQGFTPGALVRLQLQSRAGGQEARDWTRMLGRMYRQFLKSQQIAYRDTSFGSSIEFQFEYCEKLQVLCTEVGIHRLTRVSPFGAGERHTSFASVQFEEFQERAQIHLQKSDLRYDTFRSSGNGGQNVNKVESAVRITHTPTGLTAVSQTRSQSANKELAYIDLQRKVEEHFQTVHRQDDVEARKSQGAGAWGQHRRSYSFVPNQLVVDTQFRTKTGKLQALLEGDLSCIRI